MKRYALLFVMFIVELCICAIVTAAPINEYAVNRDCFHKPYDAHECVRLKLGLSLSLEENGARIMAINKNSPVYPFLMNDVIILGVRFKGTKETVEMYIKDYHNLYPIEAMIASDDTEPFIYFCKDSSFCDDDGFLIKIQISIDPNRWSSGTKPQFQQ